MAPTEVPLVRPVAGDDDLEAYYRLDAAAFGVAWDSAALEAKRPLIDDGRFLLAELDGLPVGAAGSFPFDLTLPGGATVAVAGVSDVGVLPTHRRRGVLRALLDRLHADARQRGEAAAVLTASEATIYGRFGYGVATQFRVAEVELRRAGFRADAPSASGRLRLMERADAAPVLAPVYDRATAGRAGTLSRSARWWAAVLGDADLFVAAGSNHRVVVHEDEAGVPDAYGLYRIEERWGRTGPGHDLHVWEVEGTMTAAELAVWRFLFDHDLVERAHAPLVADHLLRFVLADGRALQHAGERDFLWVHALDVDRVLSARAYAADGGLVLEVHRPDLGPVTTRLEVVDGVGSCRPEATARPDLSLGVAELGPVLLGDARWGELVRAGRVVECVDGAADRADRLFRTERSPWCGTRF
jgi:predicted acetyltransferase